MIQDITLSDPTSEFSPPEEILRVCSVGELVFVSIEAYDEGNPSTTTTVKQQIVVSLPALKEALALISTDGQREDLRGKGSQESNILGQRYVAVPL